MTWKTYRNGDWHSFICMFTGHTWQYDGPGWQVCADCGKIIENTAKENRADKPRSE